MFLNRPVADDAITKLQEALGLLEGFFGDNQYVAGPQQTVADFALASTMATIEVSDVRDGARTFSRRVHQVSAP